MDGYQFSAAIFQSLVSLAWPAALVAAVWLFREKLTSLLPLFRVKHNDWEASFRLEQAEIEVARLAPPSIPQIAQTPEEVDKFDKLAEIAPRAAVMEKYREIEDTLRRYSRERGGDSSLSVLALTRVLRKESRIDSLTAALLDDLRAYRNSAAHERFQSVSEYDAKRFATIADQVIAKIDEQASLASALDGVGN